MGREGIFFRFVNFLHPVGARRRWWGDGAENGCGPGVRLGLVVGIRGWVAPAHRSDAFSSVGWARVPPALLAGRDALQDPLRLATPPVRALPDRLVRADSH